VRRWVARWNEAPGSTKVFEDRSSRPALSPRRTSAALVERIVELRRQRLCYAAIAEQTGVSKPTICRALRARRLNRLRHLEPAEPVLRYERAAPGELLHFDIKKLGRIERVGHRISGDRRDRTRGAGWEFVHVVIDDHSRLAFAALMPDERQDSAVAFLDAALAFFARLGVKAQRIMTDNGACYQAHAFARACQRHKLRHLRTRPYRPKTNGKAERFIQTLSREWAYARSYHHSDERTAHLLPWLHRYNWHRPHSALNRMPPVSRLNLDENNLLRLHT
jgi:transposase InsO family protein